MKSSSISTFCSDVREPSVLNYSKAHRLSSHELSLGGGQLKFLVYLSGVRGHLPNSSAVLPQTGLLGVLKHGLIYLFLTTIQYLLSFASLVSSYPGPSSFLTDLCTYVVASLGAWVPFNLPGTINSASPTGLFWSLFPTILKSLFQSIILKISAVK
jgi:hypothetical protein